QNGCGAVRAPLGQKAGRGCRQLAIADGVQTALRPLHQLAIIGILDRLAQQGNCRKSQGDKLSGSPLACLLWTAAELLNPFLNRLRLRRQLSALAKKVEQRSAVAAQAGRRERLLVSRSSRCFGRSGTTGEDGESGQGNGDVAMHAFSRHGPESVQ